MDLFTLAKAVAWICTRDHEAVQNIAEDRVANSLGVAMQRYSRGDKWHLPRARPEDKTAPSPQWKIVMNSEFASSQEALTMLKNAIFDRRMPLYVFGDEGKYRPARDLELQETEIQFSEDRRASCGLWNHKEGRFVSWEPLVDLDDLQRLWPAPVLRKSVADTRRLLAKLKEVATGRRLKKGDALELMKGVPGFVRSRFEDAWRLLPAEFKYRRGERGPSKQAA